MDLQLTNTLLKWIKNIPNHAGPCLSRLPLVLIRALPQCVICRCSSVFLTKSMLTFNCAECASEFTSDYKRRKFCSSSCSASYNGRRRVRVRKWALVDCLNCGKPANSYAKDTKFCSCDCSNEYRKQRLIDDWLSNPSVGSLRNGGLRGFARAYLLKEANYTCATPGCGWNKLHPVTGKSTLEIDHIDGDAFNNKIDNLRVLCPNCHSLTPTYKALNKSTRINRPTKI
jgi:hypothetical protein